MSNQDNHKNAPPIADQKSNNQFNKPEEGNLPIQESVQPTPQTPKQGSGQENDKQSLEQENHNLPHSEVAENTCSDNGENHAEPEVNNAIQQNRAEIGKNEEVNSCPSPKQKKSPPTSEKPIADDHSQQNEEGLTTRENEGETLKQPAPPAPQSTENHGKSAPQNTKNAPTGSGIKPEKSFEKQSQPREIIKTGSHAPKSPHPPIIEYHLQLPNGKQNEYYEVDLSQFPPFKGLTSCNMYEKQKAVLMFCPDTLVLSGMLLCEATDACQLIFYGKNAQQVTVKITTTFIINPDPKTLWKTIEPTSPFFRKPHQHFERLEGKNGTLTAARIRGRSHAQRGAFCEDDFAIMIGDQFGYFGMVADGAGSAKFSRLGSKLLAESLPRFLEHIFEQQLVSCDKWQRWDHLLQGTATEQQTALEVMKELFSGVLRHSIHTLHQHTLISLKDEQTGENVAMRFRDLYSTCLAFWAYPVQAGKRWALISYWVGDGGLAIKHGGRFSLLGSPDGGEFSGQTRFFTDQELTPEALEKRLRVAFYEDLQSVWAFSDGITDPKFASEKQLENSAAWEDLTAEITPHLTKRESLLQWLAFWSQGEHDDRSLCVLEVKGNNHE